MTSFVKRILMSSATLALAASLGFAQSAEELRLTIGKSVVIDYPSDIRQIATSSPDILDASPVTTREILLHGKGLGSATLVVWSKSGQRTFYNCTVDLNVDPLRRMLKETFPYDDITVRTSRDTLSLSGSVRTKEEGDRAVAVAGSFAKTVVNNLGVNVGMAEKQILLRVKFAELDRVREIQYGVNLLGAPGGNLIGSTTGQFTSTALTGTLTVPSTTGGSSAIATITQALSLFAFDPKLNLGAFLKALESQSILQTLAEPNLVTTNGKEASFLVGGEFPVPVVQGGSGAGAVTIQFREFGIRLKFTPNLTDHKTIKMHLAQEVSTLDPGDGVTLNGFVIPALSTRRAETDVELGEGQSFVVAGLVSNAESDTFTKIPVLGSLPIIGYLFKSRDEKKNRTDLVVLVTPEITEPLGPNDPKPSVYMPRDFLVRLDPKDIPQQPSKKKKQQ
ncbi:MAG TPA: pilus assembly protein N-terminal domain-containing protein [Bryobacteraceae bacterium]|jgi:pilus assembly protein CpaC|nr:pilus assembly protein N-terminal domain-containing protein [Bryobacteraceae bacterium]